MTFFETASFVGGGVWSPRPTIGLPLSDGTMPTSSRPTNAPHPQSLRRGGVLPRPIRRTPVIPVGRTHVCRRRYTPHLQRRGVVTPPYRHLAVFVGDDAHIVPSAIRRASCHPCPQKNCHRPRRPWQSIFYIIFSSATPPARTAAASGRSPAAPAASPRIKTALSPANTASSSPAAPPCRSRGPHC